jgi:NitT/TauT family transport system substrate-binding protein
MIGCHWLTVPHGVFVRAGIDKVEDLRGKTIAVSSPGTMPELLARAALAKYGVPVSEVKFASVGGDRDRYTALVGGVVDAAVVSNEYTPIASSKNLKILVRGADAVPNFVRVCLVTTGKVIAERRDDVVRYATAQIKALRYALSHRAETIKLTREISGAKPDDPRPEFVFDDAVKTGSVSPDIPIPLDRFEWMQNQLVQSGQLPKAGDINKAVDPSIRAKALELAGR